MRDPVVCCEQADHPGQHQPEQQHHHTQEPLRLSLKLPLELLWREGELSRWGETTIYIYISNISIAVETQQPVNTEVDTATLPTPSVNTAASASSPGSTSIKSTNSFLSYKQPYFGWRSQERLKLNNGLLSSPSQRLASSLLSPPRLHRIAE